MPELDYPIGVVSIFIVISNASAYKEIFWCIRGTLMCGKRASMNHYLFYSSRIWKVNRPVKGLNLWSNSQTGSTTFSLISFSSIIHWDSNLHFLNSAINVFLISPNVLGYASPWTSFMYQLSAWSLRVVLKWVILISLSVTYLIFHTTSHRT